MVKPILDKAVKIIRKHALIKVIFAVCALMSGAGWAAPGQVGTAAYLWTSLSLKDLKGNVRNLEDFRGKVVLLFTVQYNCGGCQANAPRVGKIALAHQGTSFQALGTDVTTNSTVANLTYFEGLLKGKDTTLNFPLLRGIPANQLTDAQDGKKWSSYDAYRDVYFVIDQTGKIVYRLDGDRRNATTNANYASLDSAIGAAITKIPTTSISSARNSELCIRACKRINGYEIALQSGNIQSTRMLNLQIIDSHGRIIRSLDSRAQYPIRAGNRIVWDGKDTQGNQVPWGSYFLNASSNGYSTTLLLPWTP